MFLLVPIVPCILCAIGDKLVELCSVLLLVICIPLRGHRTLFSMPSPSLFVLSTVQEREREEKERGM